MALSVNREASAIATQKPKVTAYFEADEYEALIDLAEDEDRTLSKMTSILVREALIARGELSEDKKPRRRRGQPEE